MADAGTGLPGRAEPSRFGRLLLWHRLAAGLTQEELSSAAGVSVQAVGNLERGRARAAQPRSAEALCDGLGLAGEQRAEFLAAANTARRRVPGLSPADPLAPTWAGWLCAPPTVVPDFVGRDSELGQLRSWSGQARGAGSGLAVVLAGPAGVGKTTLAVMAADQLSAGFPDGCLAVDLRGMDEYPVPASAALDRMLRALGVHPSQLPHTVEEQSSLYRSMLAGRRMLVLLDNAADEAQARPLLAIGDGCMTIITCRRALSGLEAVRWLWLGPLPGGDAVELVARIVDAGRVRAEPQAVRELADLCGNLPLAMRIAGNRLARHPHWSIASLTARLRDERTRLAMLTAGDLQVRSVFAVSYRRLSGPAQRLFRRLALIPGADFGAELAAIAAETGQSDARLQVEELAGATLVQAAASPDRYQFHDLIRLFATERLNADETAEVRDRVGTAVREHLLRTAAIAGRWFDPDTGHQGGVEPSGEVREQTCGTSCSPAAAGVWLDQESSNWLAALRHAAAAGLHHEVSRVIRALRWYADACQQYPWADIFGWGVTAAHAAGDRHAEAALLNLLGWAQGYCRRDLDAGAAAHRRALAIAVETGDLEEQAWALGHLGAALVDLDRMDEALDHIERSIALFTRLGHGLALDRAHNTHGETLRRIGRYDDALAAHRAVLADVARRAGQMPPAAARAHRAHTLTLIGEIMLELRDWPQAAATFRDARALITASEQPWLAGEAAFHEGVARRRAGEADTAARCLRYALTLFADVTARWWHARTLAELALSLDQAGAADAARQHRRDALALCEQLGTGPARTLAAELASQQHLTRHDRRRPASTHLPAKQFARGVRGGILTVLTPSLAKIASKAPVNLVSRSRFRKRKEPIRPPRSMIRLRACRAVHAPSG